MTSDPPLRVILLINGLGTGGAERSIADVLPIYLENGIQPRVVCLVRRTDGVHDIVTQLGVPVSVLRATSFLGRANELTAMLHSESCDLIHTAIFEADMIGRVVAVRTGIPLLTSLVNTSYDRSRHQDPSVRRWKLGVLRQVEGFSARHMTTHLHALTEAVKTATISTMRVSPQDISVVPRGRDPERLGRRSLDRRASVRRSLGINGSTPVILGVGRQEFQKGHVHLIDAIASLRLEFPRVVLWLAGRDGAMTQDIRARIRRHGITDQVRMLGHRNDVPDLMAAADILAFPSLYEGLGGTLIEAMALELPIVASDLSAIREVTRSGSCAKLVRPTDATELSLSLAEMLSSPDDSRILTAAGRRRFEQVFTIDRVGQQMVQLMRDVVDMR